MKISREFSKYASEYDSLNTIQNLVAQKLLSLVKGRPQRILDLGCGSGALSKRVEWEYEMLYGVDFADGMLALHPKSQKIELIKGDFNSKELFEELKKRRFDYILSASALQWAKDLEETFAAIESLDAPIALALFTSNTFDALNRAAGLESMLNSPEVLQALQKKYFNAEFELVSYRLEFESVREMFRYIKKSGVSGARNILSISQMKELMGSYPLDYLEFEVAFISS